MWVTFHWPFSTTQNKHWVGINLSSLSPSAVIYSHEGIVDSAVFNQEQGVNALGLWLKKNISPKTPAVLVLDEGDYELLLVEAPDAPEDELASALEYRIGDLLSQPVEETAIQAVPLPSDAYRGRMSMAYVVATPNSIIKDKVQWASEHNLNLDTITVPEFSLLNVLSAVDMNQGIALLELTPSHGTIRLYQDGALYLTRQVEVGLDALKMADQDNDVAPLLLDEISSSDQKTSESIEINLDLEASENQDASLDFETNSYVSFAPKTKVNAEQTENLVLDIQRSLDYYESQLGMGQITQLWVMAGDTDLTYLVDTMQPSLTTQIEQPNIAEKIKGLADIKIIKNESNIQNSIMALGGALAYVAR